MSSIPVIDLATFRGGDAADQRRVARQMDETCRDIGFFCVAGHDISDELASAMRTTAMALFRGDPETKAQVRQPSADTIRGFIGYGSAALGDHTWRRDAAGLEGDLQHRACRRGRSRSLFHRARQPKSFCRQPVAADPRFPASLDRPISTR